MKPSEITLTEEIRTARLVILRSRRGKGIGVTANRNRAEIIFAAVDSDRARLRQFLPWVDGTKELSDSETFLGITEDSWEAKTRFDFDFFLQTGEFVGKGGLHSVSVPNRRGEFGYWVHGKYEGQGYIVEAIGALAKAAFAGGFHRLEIRCNTENRKSFAVAERLGFQLEGTLREDAVEYDRFRSTHVYGLLDRESSIS